MASVKPKAIHLIIQYGCQSRAACDRFCSVKPVEATIVSSGYSNYSKGTFDPKKVTCKRCLKHTSYREAMDRVKYPLLFWKENT